MLPLAAFPDLPGLSWVTRTPVFSTRVSSHVSGRTVRSPKYSMPMYRFSFGYDGLSSSHLHTGVYARSQQMMQDFFSRMLGQAGVFAFTDRDPANNIALDQPIGIGDGVSTSWPAVRTLLGFTETVPYLTFLRGVRLDGVPVANWSHTLPNVIHLPSAPPLGAVVSADFSYAWICRFASDTLDFEQFTHQLWSLQGVSVETVR